MDAEQSSQRVSWVGEQKGEGLLGVNDFPHFGKEHVRSLYFLFFAAQDCEHAAPGFECSFAHTGHVFTSLFYQLNLKTKPGGDPYH